MSYIPWRTYFQQALMNKNWLSENHLSHKYSSTNICPKHFLFFCKQVVRNQRVLSHSVTSTLHSFQETKQFFDHVHMLLWSDHWKFEQIWFFRPCLLVAKLQDGQADSEKPKALWIFVNAGLAGGKAGKQCECGKLGFLKSLMSVDAEDNLVHSTEK